MRKFTFSAFALALAACSDESSVTDIDLGGVCSSDSQCESGLCIDGVCLDPDGDADNDGLTNSLENRLGSNPNSPDSDGDGILDGDELDVGFGRRDTDGDGKLDIVESRIADRDGDCIPDEFDPDDNALASAEDLYDFRDILCGTPKGVCASNADLVVVTCENRVAYCDYAAIPTYQEDESFCDELDNDCDGRVDEHCNDDSDTDTDTDTDIDLIDVDSDGDGIVDTLDNCPEWPNPDQADSDSNGVGDACEPLDAPTWNHIEPVEWDHDHARFRVSGDLAAEHLISFSTSADCSNSFLSVRSEHGVYTADVHLRGEETHLYASVTQDGRKSSCTELVQLRGPVSIYFKGPNQETEGFAVQFHFPDGSPSDWVVTDRHGVATAPGIWGSIATVLATPYFFCDRPEDGGGWGQGIFGDCDLYSVYQLEPGKEPIRIAPHWNGQQEKSSNNQTFVLSGYPEGSDGYNYEYQFYGPCGVDFLNLTEYEGQPALSTYDGISLTYCLDDSVTEVDLAIWARSYSERSDGFLQLPAVPRSALEQGGVTIVQNGWQSMQWNEIDIIARSENVSTQFMAGLVLRFPYYDEHTNNFIWNWLNPGDVYESTFRWPAGLPLSQPPAIWFAAQGPLNEYSESEAHLWGVMRSLNGGSRWDITIDDFIFPLPADFAPVLRWESEGYLTYPSALAVNGWRTTDTENLFIWGRLDGQIETGHYFALHQFAPGNLMGDLPVPYFSHTFPVTFGYLNGLHNRVKFVNSEVSVSIVEAPSTDMSENIQFFFDTWYEKFNSEFPASDLRVMTLRLTSNGAE